MAALIINTISERIARLTQGLGPDRLQPVLARGAVIMVQDHFRGLDRERANAMGGRRSHFYANAARGTTSELTTGAIIIRIHHLGIRQRWQGGIIRAVHSKYLTIPARKEAYGRAAGEIPDLRVAAFRKGGQLILALVIARKDAYGNTIARRKSKRQGLVMFWLKQEVNQAPDPSVLPPADRVAAAALAAGDDYLTTLVQRGGNQ